MWAAVAVLSLAANALALGYWTRARRTRSTVGRASRPVLLSVLSASLGDARSAHLPARLRTTARWLRGHLRYDAPPVPDVRVVHSAGLARWLADLADVLESVGDELGEPPRLPRP